MLINAQTREELRVAIVDGPTLEDFQVEVAERGSTRGNIYRGTIAKIEPSLNAAFIDYGAERHGFLPIQDVVAQAYYKQPPKGEKRPRIEDVLERGKPIVVQVSKDPEASKGAALTTNLSLAGRYLVLTPFDDTRGVSRKVEDDDTRKRLKDQVRKLEVPDGCGVIVRTNALDQNKTTLMRDLSALLRLWKRIGAEARQGKGVSLIYSDQDLILQALRDYLDPAIEEILVDEDDAYARAEEYMKAYMPRGGNRLMRYQEREPLFSRYGLEPQIDRIYERRVFLPSGGSIVIDRTEALTAIDVNSGRSTGASSQEQTAVDTNLQAAVEVARQLRLRDIGGLLVVDFIDMRSNRNQRKVEKALRDAMKPDKARSTVGRISDNGLLEINRQRVHQALALRTHRTCPTCDGTGRVPSPEMVGLNLLRRIKGRAATAPLSRVRIALHPELAEVFQNARRREIMELEEEFDMRVDVVASTRLNLREQEVEWEKREGEARPAPMVRAASIRVGDEAIGEIPDDEDEATQPSGDGAAPGRRRRSRRTKSKRGDEAGARGDGKAREGAGRKSGGRKSGTRESSGRESAGEKPRRRSRRRKSDDAGKEAGAESARPTSPDAEGRRKAEPRKAAARKAEAPTADERKTRSRRTESRGTESRGTESRGTEPRPAKPSRDESREDGKAGDDGSGRRRSRRRSSAAPDDGADKPRVRRRRRSEPVSEPSASGTSAGGTSAGGDGSASRRDSAQAAAGSDNGGRGGGSRSGDSSADGSGDSSANSSGDRPRQRRRRRSSRRSGADQESS